MKSDLLTLKGILAVIAKGERLTLFEIAARLHRQHGYVRRGLIECLRRQAIETHDGADVPLYALGPKRIRTDAVVPAPGAPKNAAGKNKGGETESQNVLSGRYAKPTDPITLPPRALAKVQRDELLIGQVRGVVFNMAFDIGKALAGHGLSAAEAYAVCTAGLREAADMCEARAQLAIEKAARQAVPA